MKVKPFDLLKVEIWNEYNTLKIFTKEMYLCISGKEKSKLESKEAYDCYRKRFACEVFYHFSKQNLFLEGFQTPDKMHFLNFLSVFFRAWWILWTARNEVTTTCAVWQQYLPENKVVKKTAEENKEEQGGEKQALSPSQFQRGLCDFFDTFDKTAFIPPKCKKGKGREKGQKLIKRMKEKVLKKEKKVEKNQKNE